MDELSDHVECQYGKPAHEGTPLKRGTGGPPHERVSRTDVGCMLELESTNVLSNILSLTCTVFLNTIFSASCLLTLTAQIYLENTPLERVTHILEFRQLAKK